MRTFAGVAALALLAAGCGGDGMVAVDGRVTLDGRPVDAGTVQFLPADGPGPTSGALVTDGSFSTRLRPGRNRVRVSSQKVENPAAPEDLYKAPQAGRRPVFPKVTELVPERYNTKSELVVEIPPPDGLLVLDLTTR